MYQSLYRKYRPKNFDEVVGQNTITKTLKNAIEYNKISHAYLFTGPRGTGKTSTAKILAKIVNCEHLDNYNPCEKCVNCTQYNKKQAVDIIEIDAASNNGVEEIRELKSKISLAPTYGKYKVYIIDEVHMLSTGAFNALLKTLEEPPSHVIFILATTEPYKIPITILSRCQRFDFKKIDNDDIVKRLRQIVNLEGIHIEDAALNAIASLSDGGMRDSLSLLDQAISYSNDKITLEDIHEINGTITPVEINDFFKQINQKNYETVFKKIDNYNQSGKDFYKLTEEIILYLRDLLLNNFIRNNTSKVDDLFLTKENTINYIEKFNDSLFEMKNTNNMKLIFELTIIRLIDLDYSDNSKVEPITTDIVEYNQKLNNIEKIIDIRINNTLCFFNKKEYLKFKDDVLCIRDEKYNQKYSEIIDLILDGDIKAYGNNYFIIVYTNNVMVRDFNDNILLIDDLFLKKLNLPIHGIAVDSNQWEKIKKEYNSKIKNYEYREENDL